MHIFSTQREIHAKGLSTLGIPHPACWWWESPNYSALFLFTAHMHFTFRMHCIQVFNRELWKESSVACTGYVHSGECVIYARSLHEKCHFCSSPPPPWVNSEEGGQCLTEGKDQSNSLHKACSLWIIQTLCHRWYHSQMHIVRTMI